MPKIKLAGLVVDIRRDNPILNNQISDYITDDAAALDITVDFKEDYIEEEIEQQIRMNLSFPPEYSEYLAIYRYVCTELTRHSGFLIHGSAISYHSAAYLFCAPSGTGKSTHARMWRLAFGSEVGMINDDKPVIRLINGEFHACGTPWSGKHDLDSNICVPLKGICLLRRSAVNSVKRLDATASLAELFSHIYRPRQSEAYLATVDLVGRMLETCPVYELNCNISEQAAICAESAIVPHRQGLS